MFSIQHPCERWCYAVTTGTYCGEMLFFMEKTTDSYMFLSLPKNVNRTIPIDKYNVGVDSNIVETVEKIPSKVFNLLKKQFLFNKKHK